MTTNELQAAKLAFNKAWDWKDEVWGTPREESAVYNAMECANVYIGRAEEEITALEAQAAEQQQRIERLEAALEQARQLALGHEREWIDTELTKPFEERRPLIHIQWGQLASILGDALRDESGVEGA